MATKKKESKPEIAKGDLVYTDPDGYQTVEGVKMIKVVTLDNGEDLYPDDMENVVLVCKAKDRHDK